MVHEKFNHPHIHKMAGFRSQINRMLNTPINEKHKREEKDIIKQLPTNNGYDEEMIGKLIRRAEK